MTRLSFSTARSLICGGLSLLLSLSVGCDDGGEQADGGARAVDAGDAGTTDGGGGPSVDAGCRIPTGDAGPGRCPGAIARVQWADGGPAGPAGIDHCPPAEPHTLGANNRVSSVGCVGNSSECREDTDCGPGMACLCSAGITAPLPCRHAAAPHLGLEARCVPAECRSAADCGGFACGIEPGQCDDPAALGLFCRTADDECLTGHDCEVAGTGNICLYAEGEGRWTCNTTVDCP